MIENSSFAITIWQNIELSTMLEFCCCPHVFTGATVWPCSAVTVAASHVNIIRCINFDWLGALHGKSQSLKWVCTPTHPPQASDWPKRGLTPRDITHRRTMLLHFIWWPQWTSGKILPIFWGDFRGRPSQSLSTLVLLLSLFPINLKENHC